MNTTSLRNGERTMRTCDFKFKAMLKAAALVAAILLLSASVSFGQQVVNLTAGSAGITLPDGTGVPMWGYSCGTPVATVSTTASAVNGTTVTVAVALPINAVNAYIGTTLTVGTLQGIVTSNTATTLTVASWFPSGVAFSVPATGTAVAINSTPATTTYTATTATDTSLAMVPNAYVGATITVGAATGKVTGNTATTLTFSAGWSGVTAPAVNAPISIAASAAACAPLNTRSIGGYVGAIGVVNGG